MQAAVGGLKQALAGVVKRVGVVRRNNDRRGPLKAMLEIGRTLTIADFRIDCDVLQLPGTFVKTSDLSLVIAGVDDVRLGRVRSNVASFSASDVVPVGAVDGGVVAAAGDRDGAVVLLGAVHVVGRPRVRDYMVELRRGLVKFVGP